MICIFANHPPTRPRIGAADLPRLAKLSPSDPILDSNLIFLNSLNGVKLFKSLKPLMT